MVPGGTRGPAAARNAGWRAAGDAPWIVFLDDDVVPGPTWADDLALDLAGASVATAGISARIEVPLPVDRAPTDWERNVAGLAGARWITADMAYRRKALEAVGGFDERFRRAFREDADLALRVLDAGWTLAEGRRTTTHPVRPADRWVSVRLQAGNADDVLMTRLHGRDWWRRAGAPRGRLPLHLAVTSAGLAAAVCALTGRPRAASACAAGWLAGTAEFALARIRPGPRTRDEIVTMALTGALVPLLPRPGTGCADRCGTAPRPPTATGPRPRRRPPRRRPANGCRHDRSAVPAPAGAERTLRPHPRPAPDPRTAVSAPRPRPITEVSP